MRVRFSEFVLHRGGTSSPHDEVPTSEPMPPGAVCGWPGAGVAGIAQLLVNLEVTR